MYKKNYNIKRVLEMILIYTLVLMSIVYYINLLAVITLGDLF